MTTTTNTRYVFKAYFDNGDIVEWPSCYSYTYVSKMFKWTAQLWECNGSLWCNGVMVRETGDWPEIDET